jgi:hypothetical protein
VQAQVDEHACIVESAPPLTAAPNELP